MLKTVTRSKQWFYWRLWHNYLGRKQCTYLERINRYAAPSVVSNELLDGKRIHFWVPHHTAGAQFILWEVIPKLISKLAQDSPSSKISIATDLPKEDFDLVLSFKEPIPANVKTKSRCLIICDELDRLWGSLRLFDSVVCTSSFELAHLIETQVEQIYFIGEIEPRELIQEGSRRIVSTSTNDQRSLFWHGGHNTLRELAGRINWFKELREITGFETLELVSGDGSLPRNLCDLNWINPHAWSRENLASVSRRCRLAVLPARLSLKNSYLKPASRQRCCLAMGLPAVGDARVPEVSALSSELNLPVLNFRDKKQSLEVTASLWNDPLRLRDAVFLGHALVEKYFSQTAAISSWERTLSALVEA